MLLKLKQHFISLWKTSYSVKDENDKEIFKVSPSASLLTRFKIVDKDRNVLLVIKKEYFKFLPHYKIVDKDGHVLAKVKKRWSWTRNAYEITSMIEGDTSKYSMDSNVMGWAFVLKRDDQVLCSMGKKLFKLTDTYEIDVQDEDEMLLCIAMGVIMDHVQHNNKRS